MKLIDAEKFASDIRQIAQIHWGGLYWLGLDTIERILALEPAVEHYPKGLLAADDVINEMPTLNDTFEDTEKVKQGRWIKSDDGDDGWCSRCKCDMPMFMNEDWEWEYTETAYCPNCGSKMRGIDDEDYD